MTLYWASQQKPVKYALQLLSAALLLTLFACSPPPENRVLTETSVGVIVPAYGDFVRQSTRLSQASASFCQAAEQTSAMETVRQQWRQTANAWAAIQSLQFGPLLQDNQSWKIQFWPDKKNLIARKVEALLAGDSALNAERIDKASVVVQGLSAIEYLLFDSSAGSIDAYSGPAGARRCELVQASTEHLQGVADYLHRAWRPDGGDYSGRFSKPGPDNASFPDAGVALANLAESLVYGAELVRRDKLERPAGLSDGKAQPYQLEWWRSGHSSAAIAAQLRALKTLYRGGEGFGLDDLLRAKAQNELAETIDQQFELSIAAADALPGKLFDAISAGQDAAALAALDSASRDLISLLKRDLPAALGIKLGFNAKDGD